MNKKARLLRTLEIVRIFQAHKQRADANPSACDEDIDQMAQDLARDIDAVLEAERIEAIRSVRQTF